MLYSIHQGVVGNTLEYGAFVTLDNLGCDGLVRISQLDNNFVEDVTEVVRIKWTLVLWLVYRSQQKYGGYYTFLAGLGLRMGCSVVYCCCCCYCCFCDIYFPLIMVFAFLNYSSAGPIRQSLANCSFLMLCSFSS